MSGNKQNEPDAFIRVKSGKIVGQSVHDEMADGIYELRLWGTANQTPAVAVNESVGVIERYGYQALFNAIAEATKIEGGHIGVSVIAFAKSLEAAIAAAEQMKGGVR